MVEYREDNSVKQLLKIFVGAVFATLGCAGLVCGDQAIAHDYRFSAPSLTAVTNGYTQIAVQDCSVAPQPGAPQLPFLTVKLLLPAGASISSVTAEPLSVSQPLAESVKVDFGRTPRSPAVPFAGTDEPDPATTIVSPLPFAWSVWVNLETLILLETNDFSNSEMAHRTGFEPAIASAGSQTMETLLSLIPVNPNEVIPTVPIPVSFINFRRVNLFSVFISR